jgi:AcrR family transcriptional regulator
VSSILARGYYRASSNEIARRAGVSWGAIQHYFGTREALMLAVLEDGMQQFASRIVSEHVEGDTPEERIAQLVDIVFSYYAQPEYVAYLQVLLNLEHDPRTSAEVRARMRTTADRSYKHVRRLLSETLGPAMDSADLRATIYLAMRGFALNEQLMRGIEFNADSRDGDSAARVRQVFVEILGAYVSAGEPAPKRRRRRGAT